MHRCWTNEHDWWNGIMKKHSFLAMLIGLLSVFIGGCPDNRLTPRVNPVELTAVSNECTKIYIGIQVNAESEHDIVLIDRTGPGTTGESKKTYSVQMKGRDTVICDAGLLPGQQYSYSATYGTSTASLRSLSADSTVSDWGWSMTTFGVSSSTFYDACVVNDSLAYAVGEVYALDSNGVYEDDAYNIAIWDGQRWRLDRIYFWRICGQQSMYSYPIDCMFRTPSGTLWLSAAGEVVQYRNGKQSTPVCFPAAFQATKLWGRNDSDMYAIGYFDNLQYIVHYNGSTWKVIFTSTMSQFRDIWGGTNPWLKGNSIWAVSGDVAFPTVARVMSLNGNSVDSVTFPYSYYERLTVWFDTEGPVYAGGNGVYQYINGQWQFDSDIPLKFVNQIRGNSWKDMAAVGDFGKFAYYNGSHWKMYDEIRLPQGVYKTVSMKGDIIVVAGWLGVQAVVAVGKRSVESGKRR